MTKILIDEAVVRQALEYLKDNQHHIADNERHAYVMLYNAFIERFEQTIAEAEQQQALDKMADNARELGLSYDASVAQIDTSAGRVEKEAENKDVPAPAQEPVADKHQAFIDSLPSDMEDKMFEQIHYWARQSYARHQRSTRGQTITAADSSDNHIIWAALRWAKENAATPQAQPAQQEPHPPYEFERYVAGSLRAQGVRVERATTLADAMRIAAKICPPANPPSAPTVLVYTTPQAQPLTEIPLLSDYANKKLRKDKDGDWALVLGDDHIRYLNMFERNFVDSAIEAAQGITKGTT